jgi:hypothetical protein
LDFSAPRKACGFFCPKMWESELLALGQRALIDK